MSTIKKRTIHIENMSCNSCEHTIAEVLQHVDGVQSIHIDVVNNTITVMYDVLATDLEHIEQQLGQAGYIIHDSIMHRIKDTVIHFTEENERDNLNAPHLPCCSYPDNMLERIKLPRIKVH